MKNKLSESVRSQAWSGIGCGDWKGKLGGRRGGAINSPLCRPEAAQCWTQARAAVGGWVLLHPLDPWFFVLVLRKTIFPNSNSIRNSLVDEKPLCRPATYNHFFLFIIYLLLMATYTPFWIIAMAHSLWTLWEHGRIWQPLNASCVKYRKLV